MLRRLAVDRLGRPLKRHACDRFSVECCQYCHQGEHYRSVEIDGEQVLVCCAVEQAILKRYICVQLNLFNEVQQ
jgi:hypothetical protein